MRILVTGAAGFIGQAVAKALLEQGHEIHGLDNLNDYYDVRLKEARLNQLRSYPNFHFHRQDLADDAAMDELFRQREFSQVVHLAAQAGVRYSLQNPRVYGKSNLTGFLNILEGCRAQKVEHLVFASSSSVYGLNSQLPFSESQNVDHPVSLYAATKKSNELMAHSYSHLFGLPVTGLRFFTVYGPWGRPDMALFLFTKAILEGREIEVFNHGRLQRDFTYIDDIVTGVLGIIPLPPQADPHWTGDDPATSSAPYRICNIGNNNPVELEYFISTLEEALGKKARRRYLPMQAGDVLTTFADTGSLESLTGFAPTTPIATGISRFVEWYCSYYQI